MKRAGHLLELGAWAVAMIGAGSLSACHQPTEIVLVVDTYLSCYDIDQVNVAVTGTQTTNIDVSLAAPTTPPFPWTLGLEPGGQSGSRRQVSVVASLMGNPVVQQAAETTTFVRWRTRRCCGSCCSDLRASASPLFRRRYRHAQTCSAGTCVPLTRSPRSPPLPSWTGSALRRARRRRATASAHWRPDPHLGERMARLRQRGGDPLLLGAELRPERSATAT